jgi:hypothetical protein
MMWVQRVYVVKIGDVMDGIRVTARGAPHPPVQHPTPHPLGSICRAALSSIPHPAGSRWRVESPS